MSIPEIPIKVSVNSPIKGELEIEKGRINVIMGRRYKTYLLKSIYSAITGRGWHIDVDIRVEHGPAYAHIRNALLEKHGKLSFNAVLFPEDFVNDGRVLSLVDEFRKGKRYKYYGAEVPEALERLYYDPEDKMLYIENQGERVPFSNASTSEKKIAIIATLAETGLLGDPETTVLLFDEPNTSLHPQDELKLAYLLGLLAEKGYTVIVSTDDMDFLSMLSCINAVPKQLGQRVFAKPVLSYTLNLIKDKEILQYDIRSSAIPTYTGTLLDIYKNC